jgi:hypothetical protein
MRGCLRFIAIGLGSTLLLAGCGTYDPDMQGDHAAPQYKADLAACQKLAGPAAIKRVNSLGYLFLTYPISYPRARRAAVRTCMEGKGYKLKG